MAASSSSSSVRKFPVFSPREGRLVHYFERVQDDFWPYGDWPAWVRGGMLIAHKKRALRFNLMFFFTGNGLPGELADFWVRCADFLSGQLVVSYYDKEAMRDQADIIKRSANGTLFTGNKQVFCMTTGRVISM